MTLNLYICSRSDNIPCHSSTSCLEWIWQWCRSTWFRHSYLQPDWCNRPIGCRWIPVKWTHQIVIWYVRILYCETVFYISQSSDVLQTMHVTSNMFHQTVYMKTFSSNAVFKMSIKYCTSRNFYQTMYLNKCLSNNLRHNIIMEHCTSNDPLQTLFFKCPSNFVPQKMFIKQCTSTNVYQTIYVIVLSSNICTLNDALQPLFAKFLSNNVPQKKSSNNFF